jgi:hypothetical protein
MALPAQRPAKSEAFNQPLKGSVEVQKSGIMKNEKRGAARSRHHVW